jgi:hypothetical protein
MARRSKLTDEVQQRVCDALSIGVPRSTAAQAAGITERTLYNWLEKGEAHNRGRYFQFFQAVQAAEVQSEMTAMAVWRRGMSDDWRAAKDFLERRYPDKYGLPKDKGDGDSATREVFVIHHDQLTEEEWSALAQAQLTGDARAAGFAPTKGE